MNEQQRRPWDQLPNEPDESYKHFLIYRNMGPGRSLHAAYGQLCIAKQREIKASIPGNWTSDSSRFRWVERCKAWDIFVLLEQGPAIAKDFLEAIRIYANNLIDSLRNDGATNKPIGFESITKAIDTLGKLLTPEFLDAYATRLQSDLAEASKPGESGQ